MLLLLGAVLVFAALVMSLSIMGVLTSERRAVARSVAAVQAINSAPSIMTAELDRAFAERVIAPLGGRLVGIGRKITRADTAVKIAHRLDIAGNPPAWDVNRIIGLKVLGLGALGAIGFLFGLSRHYPINKVLLVTAGFAVFGYVLPNLLLKNAGDKREALMRNAL